MDIRGGDRSKGAGVGVCLAHARRSLAEVTWAGRRVLGPDPRAVRGHSRRPLALEALEHTGEVS